MQQQQVASAPADHSRIADIEVLRALAVGMVLVQHVPGNLAPWMFGHNPPLYRWFGFGSGVDLFFAISGFVIARSLLPILPPASAPVAFFNTAFSFWVRRAWRLLPSAWLWLAIPLVASVAFNRSGAFGSFQANFDGAVAAFLTVANFHFAYVFGRFSPGAVFPYWTLSLEEQFYIALPLLVFFARQRLPLVLVVMVAAQFFIRRVSGDQVLSVVRCDALSLGVLLAIWSNSASYRRVEPTGLKARAAQLLLPPALVAIFAAASGPAFVPDQIRTGVVAALAAAIVWVASYDRGFLFPPGALKRALCWGGGRSYGIYLIHVPAFFATRELWSRLSPDMLGPSSAHLAILLATAIPLTLALAEINFRLVEVPLRRRGARIAENIRRRGLSEEAVPAMSLPT